MNSKHVKIEDWSEVVKLHLTYKMRKAHCEMTASAPKCPFSDCSHTLLVQRKTAVNGNERKEVFETLLLIVTKSKTEI